MITGKLFFEAKQKGIQLSFISYTGINGLRCKINQISSYISSFTSKVALNKHEAPSAITIR